ncbi:xylanase [Paenibacillus sp. F411]|uniref:glycosyl hydrolase family 8 n=1 Tax=Paenibacillus sp. F411 TaxID=2820239 RepID=UPI001AAF16D2|nr:glycosyl hydrolase family 8 [Paenibacillus sp. F411]MBO2944361.1 xylanase [Paenibacillus sp. F411]
MNTKSLKLFVILAAVLIGVALLWAQERTGKEEASPKTYRSVFQELGKSEEDISAKLQQAWDQMFYGDDAQQRIYYPVGEDMAYILDTGYQDVRTEGMSYGMMIAVQLDKKEEFDRLWNWAVTYMQHKEGPFKHYFSWHNTPKGDVLDSNPAPDGEEYFAMALLFASNRWGDGEGIYHYREQGNKILQAMLHQADDGEGYNMFDEERNQIVFVPWTSGKGYTDPSYHLPAFYELWARWAETDRERWAEMAKVSRAFWAQAADPDTGLMANYTTFDGVPYRNGDHYLFSYDAHRVALNVTLDEIWHGGEQSEWRRGYIEQLHQFFIKEGIDRYVARYTVEGKPMADNRSSGLIAVNGAASMISTHEDRLQFAQRLWDMDVPTGQYRYYDSMLYMFSLLAASGQYQIIEP